MKRSVGFGTRRRSAGACVAAVAAVVGWAAAAQAQGKLSVSPEVAEPGALVVLQGGPEQLPDAKHLLVGGKPVVLERRKDKGLMFRVPSLPPGPVDIALKEARGTEVVAKLVIAERSHQELMLSLEGGKARVLSVVKRGAGKAPATPRDQRRVAWEVLNKSNGLVATGAIPYPDEVEVHEGGSGAGGKQPEMRRVRTSSPLTMLRVPAVPGGARLRLYEVPAGVALDKAPSQMGLQPLGEIELTDKQGREVLR